jgi:hypothetical protein
MPKNGSGHRGNKGDYKVANAARLSMVHKARNQRRKERRGTESEPGAIALQAHRAAHRNPQRISR